MGKKWDRKYIAITSKKLFAKKKKKKKKKKDKIGQKIYNCSNLVHIFLSSL